MHAHHPYIAQQHDLALVGLATLVCCLGAGSGFALGREALRSRDRWGRLAWGLASLVAITPTIWTTHLIFGVASEPSTFLGFDGGLTVLSYLVPLTLAAVGTAVVGLATRPSERAVGGAVLGIAIAVTHLADVGAHQAGGRPRPDMRAVWPAILPTTLFAVSSILLSLSRMRRPGFCDPFLFVLAVCLAQMLCTGTAAAESGPTPARPGDGRTAILVTLLTANAVLLVAGLSLAAVWFSSRTRRQLDAEERHLRYLADVAVDGLLICQGETIVRINRSLEQTLSCENDDLIGKDIGEVLPSSSTIPVGREVDAHLNCVRVDKIPVRVIAQDLLVASKRHRVFTVRDQRERLRNEAKMMLLAHHDSLTGLANRLNFNETLAGRLLLPSSEDVFALIMLDLDRFKAVNDTLGHGMGDELLRRVAGRLRRVVRADDLVARLGGDEFAIIANIGGNQAAVRRIAADIVDLLERPFLIDGQIIDIGTSIGIALAPTDGDQPADLARNADLALYRAKQEGGSTYRFFEAEMNIRVQARRALELDLRRAAARQEFEVHYQPQADPRTGMFDGAEALVRWRHPRRGMVSPAEFIPLAEEIGLIGSIGDWVLRTACAEAARWPEHLSVAVNVSPVQFRDAGLAASVAAILAETGLPGERLELEITETALMQDDGHTLQVLHALRALGVRISMDDFGTGYSSLSYLRRFPFNKIKIDQSFIRQVPGDADSIAIVQAITTLGLKLGMTVTVEGVETLEQRAFTATEGCDQIQGYLISRPVPAEQVRELLARSVAARAAA